MTGKPVFSPKRRAKVDLPAPLEPMTKTFFIPHYYEKKFIVVRAICEAVLFLFRRRFRLSARPFSFFASLKCPESFRAAGEIRVRSAKPYRHSPPGNLSFPRSIRADTKASRPTRRRFPDLKILHLPR